jgi:uncharacterized protein
MQRPGNVFLCRVPDSQPNTWAEAVDRLLDSADLPSLAARNDRVAVKVHVGEVGLRTALPPEVASPVARRLRAAGALPFFTDTAVLYSGRRSNGVAHTEVAIEHGFTMERAGAVFIPADGMIGNLEVEVGIEGRHYSSVGVAEAVAHANALVTVSHMTGHMLSGFGATLKNIGMGCAPRKGKLLQHSDTKPFVKNDRCGVCCICTTHCPTGAIALDEQGFVRIDEATCTGCGECLAHCRDGAIGFQWDAGSATMQEKMVEHAVGAVKAVKGHILCILGIVNLTQHCDCWGAGSEIVAPDIGFAMSIDPVALDQAALDLVAASTGQPLDRIAWPKLDGTVQLSYAESLGLGSRSYSLIQI